LVESLPNYGAGAKKGKKMSDCDDGELATEYEDEIIEQKNHEARIKIMNTCTANFFCNDDCLVCTSAPANIGTAGHQPTTVCFHWKRQHT
jgi:hypothetical protein